MKKMPKLEKLLNNLLSAQGAFLVGGLCSTAASIDGTLPYIMAEIGGGWFMSGTAAFGMGGIIYAGWEVAFNHRGLGKRLSMFAVAATFAALSTWTIYQNTAAPAIKAEQDRQSAVQVKAEAAVQRIQAEADRSRKALEQQAADIRASITDLRKQNDTALADVEAVQAAGGKNADWKAAQIRKGIEGRNTQIGTLTGQATALATRQAATGPATTDASTSPASPAAQPAATWSWAMLARSALYEIITVLCLLFASIYKRDGSAKEQAQVATLHAAQAAHDGASLRLEAAVNAANLTATAHTACIREAGALAGQQAQAATEAARRAEAQTQAAATAAANAAAAAQSANATAQKTTALVGNATTTAAEAARLAHAAAEAAKQAADQTNTHAADIGQATAGAKDMLTQLQIATLQCNKAIAHADDAIAHAMKPIAHAMECAIDQKPQEMPELTNDSVLSMLKNRRIEPAADGSITLEAITQATGWGRPKATKVREEAFVIGILARSPLGKGFTYHYSDEESLLLLPETTRNAPSNVVSINQANTQTRSA